MRTLSLNQQPRRPHVREARPSSEAAIYTALRELNEKYNAGDDALIAEHIEATFRMLLSVNSRYLDQYRVFENISGIKLAQNSTPPRYFYEIIDKIDPLKLEGSAKDAFSTLQQFDRARNRVTLAAIETCRSILTQSQRDSPPTLLECNKMAGSMIGRVIRHIAAHQGAEINCCKNPYVRAPNAEPVLA